VMIAVTGGNLLDRDSRRAVLHFRRD
jgi:hypothetical protein